MVGSKESGVVGSKESGVVPLYLSASSCHHLSSPPPPPLSRCLSRQRSWGVPLPAFYRKDTGEALLDDESVAHVQAVVARHGADAWWRLSEEELLPPRLAGEAHLWRKGTDTLDVWFDSGCSWAAVMPHAAAPHGAPHGGVTQADNHTVAQADIYLEGSDQHRGWFQSSLLTRVGSGVGSAAQAEGGGGEARGAGSSEEGAGSMVEHGGSVAPYSKVVTHGFVLDEKGVKMSKSLGNVITPRQLIGDAPPPDATPPAAAAPPRATTEATAPTGKKLKKAKRAKPAAGDGIKPCGADVLRLWVALSDWRSDVSIGEITISKARD